ncbi:MAG: response regulator [Spirochaetales bacterium]|nr:response regulator [Spirochaetales bacterium]
MKLNKLLFTDDDPDIINLILLCLEDSEFIVETCLSGQETLNKIPIFKPDLILLDVSMPRMDGIMTLKSMQEDKNLESIPVVFLTANSGEKEIKKLLDLGAVDVIVKPFQPFEIAERISEIWKNKIIPGSE